MLLPFNPLRLLAAFRKWTENRVVFELCVDVNSGEKLEKLDRFFKKKLSTTGRNYLIPLVGKIGISKFLISSGPMPRL